MGWVRSCHNYIVFHECNTLMMLSDVLLCCGLVLYLSVLGTECACMSTQLIASDTPAYITSTLQPGCRDGFFTCEWEIQGPPNKKLKLTVARSQISNNGSCQSGDHVKVYNGVRSVQNSILLGVFCGDETPIFVSKKSAATIKLSDQYGCNNSFVMEYQAIDSTANSAWSWKEMLIFAACAACLLITFHLIQRYIKAKHQRRVDMETGNVIENRGVTSLEGNSNSSNAPPPTYDEVIKADEEALPRYSALYGGQHKISNGTYI